MWSDWDRPRKPETASRPLPTVAEPGRQAPLSFTPDPDETVPVRFRVQVEPAPPPRRAELFTPPGWLPLAVGGALVAVVFGIVLGVRAAVSTGAAPPAPDTPLVIQEPVVVDEPVALPPLEPSRAEAPTTRGGVRFSARPIEPSYTVAAGDTLYEIAQRFSTTVEALQSINNLDDRARLAVGQKLVIP